MAQPGLIKYALVRALTTTGNFVIFPLDGGTPQWTTAFLTIGIGGASPAPAVISVGSNGTSYDNIMPATLISTYSAGRSVTIVPANSAILTSLNGDVRLNITVGSTLSSVVTVTVYGSYYLPG